jgi:4-hydroxy-4-methyl-2-oxoglutarate aldolase
MAESEKDYSVLELQARWDKIRVANIYDTLDKMGYGNQVLDLGIRPLFPHQHLAGKAVTVRGGRDPRVNEEITEDKSTASFVSVFDLLFPGAVIVIDGGGEPVTGKFGEMTSWSAKQRGAKGIVIDGFIRDHWGLEVIPDYTVCARGTSPIESYKRWRIHETNTVIAMPGTLTSQVRVAPGDWIVAEADGVIVIPQEIAMEALIKAEEIERREEGMRQDLAKGMPFKEAYEKWGRA